jgi:hypothetical protein
LIIQVADFFSVALSSVLHQLGGSGSASRRDLEALPRAAGNSVANTIENLFNSLVGYAG